jgi:hypothetical protein
LTPHLITWPPFPLSQVERTRREVETHELRQAVAGAEERARTAVEAIASKDEELKRELKAKAEVQARLDAATRQAAVAAQQQREAAAAALAQQDLLKAHVASLQQLLGKAQDEAKAARAKQDEMAAEQATAAEMDEYMVAVAKFCNVKPPSKGGARRASVVAGSI